MRLRFDPEDREPISVIGPLMLLVLAKLIPERKGEVFVPNLWPLKRAFEKALDAAELRGAS